MAFGRRAPDYAGIDSDILGAPRLATYSKDYIYGSYLLHPGIRLYLR